MRTIGARYVAMDTGVGHRHGIEGWSRNHQIYQVFVCVVWYAIHIA